MNSSIFNIVYSKLFQWLTPAMLRKKFMLAWIRVCISPVSYIYNNLLRYRARKAYELSITPQVFSLENMLNDKYDPIQRRIRIVDSLEKDLLYIYTDIEDKPVYIFTDPESNVVYIYTDTETIAYIDDFIVQVPKAVSFNFNEMKSLVTYYKLASKQFKIATV